MILFVLLCLSADWPGALVLLNSFFSLSCFVWPPVLAVDWLAFVFLVSSLSVSFSGGAGARIVRPACFGLLWLAGVASAWLALSLLPSPALPAPSVSPLAPSCPVGALLVPPMEI